jgi:methionine biosynthesis protein MetW
MTVLRADLRIIAGLVAPGAKVLDIGCGDGELLAWLSAEKNVDGRGLELSQPGVNASIARGLSVVQGDADTDLHHYPSQTYDYVILSQTLQTMRDPRAVLGNLVRIGKCAIVSVPNFGYWKNRLYMLVRGRMPVTRTLAYEWYDTPNIHFCTLSDFIELCERMRISIEKRVYVEASGVIAPFQGRSAFANLLGEQGIFMLRGERVTGTS